VETREQFEYLKSIGCHQAQGYLFSKPLSSSELVTLLEKNK
jgi:EAL domain-containing protein (putative c-di-GMP-specific phosphodiesterase class I)